MRVSAFHPVSVLLPGVATVADIVAARSVLEEAKLSLAGDGTAFKATIPLGAMVETPDLATSVAVLAPHVDFLCLGTDNLLQQGLPSDRPNTRGQLDALHPGALRRLEAVAAVARANMKGLSIWGEMAEAPDLTPLLLGLGVRALVVTPNRLPEVKAAIRRTRLAAAQKLAEAALQMGTRYEVLELVKRAL